MTAEPTTGRTADPEGPPGSGLDPETRERLLDATGRLVRQIGIAKTSMADVARAAGVARGTLYRYFESRESLFNAVRRRITDQFFADVAAAMDAKNSLSDQLGAFCELQIAAIHPASEIADNLDAMIHQMSAPGGHALRRTARFLQPYVEAARARGEVRGDIDMVDASEWLARILLSFTIFQVSVSYEAGDPASASSFVQRYAIRGLGAG